MWRDLSDEELRSRLTQRGVSVAAARIVVEERDNPGGAAFLDKFFESDR